MIYVHASICISLQLVSINLIVKVIEVMNFLKDTLAPNLEGTNVPSSITSSFEHGCKCMTNVISNITSVNLVKKRPNNLLLFICILFGWQLKEIKPYLIELLKNIYKYNCFESTKSLTHLLDSGWMEMSIKSFHSLTHTFTLYHYETAFQQTRFSSFVFVCHDSWGLLYH